MKKENIPLLSLYSNVYLEKCSCESSNKYLDFLWNNNLKFIDISIEILIKQPTIICTVIIITKYILPYHKVKLLFLKETLFFYNFWFPSNYIIMSIFVIIILSYLNLWLDTTKYIVKLDDISVILFVNTKVLPLL